MEIKWWRSSNCPSEMRGRPTPPAVLAESIGLFFDRVLMIFPVHTIGRIRKYVVEGFIPRNAPIGLPGQIRLEKIV